MTLDKAADLYSVTRCDDPFHTHRSLESAQDCFRNANPMHDAVTLTGGSVPAHVPGAYPRLSCCGGPVALAEEYNRKLVISTTRLGQRGVAERVGADRLWTIEASDLRLTPGEWPHLINAEGLTLARCKVERDADNDVRWVDFTDTFGRNTVRIFND